MRLLSTSDFMVDFVPHTPRLPTRRTQTRRRRGAAAFRSTPARTAARTATSRVRCSGWRSCTRSTLAASRKGATSGIRSRYESHIHGSPSVCGLFGEPCSWYCPQRCTAFSLLVACPVFSLLTVRSAGLLPRPALRAPLADGLPPPVGRLLQRPHPDLDHGALHAAHGPHECECGCDCD